MSDLARAQGVRDVVARIAHTIDFRRWSDLRALYGDQVSTDYTSLFGGEVQQQRADDLIEGWRRLLAPLDATQHLLGPIAVQLQGGSAIAECHVRGYHVLHGAAGGDELMVAGQWLIELSERGDGWRITSMTLKTLYQSGNKEILRQAIAGPAPQP
jgi:hypothetical protein